MKLLDTTIIIGIVRGDKDLKEVVEKLDDEELATTVLTYFELFSRIYRKKLRREGRILRSLLKLMNVFELDEASSDKAAEIMGRLLAAGRPINVLDVLISGIALAYGIEEIITRDADFKAIEEVYGYPKVSLV